MYTKPGPRAEAERTERVGRPVPPDRRPAAAPALAAEVLRRSAAGGRLTAGEVLHLQRTVGNHAVAGLLGARGLVQRGVGKSKPAAVEEPTYYAIGADVGEYAFAWAADSAAGGRVEVSTPLEDGIIGYANFTLENKGLVAAPAADAAYTQAHVLGRQAGVVCYLSGIFNLSLTRDGPANIYRGFGNALLGMVEAKAGQRGAGLIYLVPSVTPARTSPNSNVKANADPTGFYTHHGYAVDAAATQHNAAIVEAQYAGLGVPQEQIDAQKPMFTANALGGILSKAL
ncbi:MAG: hypothetical protein JWM27_4027 [Gemmatimonadetes bacterium]|nr:hypothetical protein [Gemmatimonadota bacterium]